MGLELDINMAVTDRPTVVRAKLDRNDGACEHQACSLRTQSAKKPSRYPVPQTV